MSTVGSRPPATEACPPRSPAQPRCSASGLVLTASLNLRADRGELDEDDVAERLLRVLGDADGRNLAVDLDPLVVLRELLGCRQSVRMFG
jgi:hypothetical protein